MHFRTAIFLLSIASIALLSNNCATKVEGLFVSDAFKVATIKKGNIVVGGVVSGVKKISHNERAKYANVLRAQIMEEREYYKVKPVNYFISAVGTKNYQNLMKKYRASGFDSNTLKELSGKLEGVRFLALAKIDSNETAKDRSETSEKKVKDSKGKTKIVPGEIVKNHKRTVFVTMHVYDLKNFDVAFTGTVDKSETNSRSYEKNLISNIVSIVSAVKGEEEDKRYPYPNAPSTQKVLTKVFIGFAENFPEEE